MSAQQSKNIRLHSYSLLFLLIENGWIDLVIVYLPSNIYCSSNFTFAMVCIFISVHFPILFLFSQLFLSTVQKNFNISFLISSSRFALSLTPFFERAELILFAAVQPQLYLLRNDNIFARKDERLFKKQQTKIFSGSIASPLPLPDLPKTLVFPSPSHINFCQVSIFRWIVNVCNIRGNAIKARDKISLYYTACCQNRLHGNVSRRLVGVSPFSTLLQQDSPPAPSTADLIMEPSCFRRCHWVGTICFLLRWEARYSIRY